MADLLQLADACEKAEGPDRELDALIECVISNRRPWSNPEITVPADQADHYEIPEGVWTLANLHEVGLPLMKEDHPAGEWARGPNGRTVIKNQNRHYPARFSASLDAAMTLVPEGAGLDLSRYWIAAVEGPVWSAHITTGGVPDNPRQVFECFDAPTPALALCAAALRARASA